MQTEVVTLATMLSSATSVMTSAVGSTWDMISGNSLLQFFVGTSVLGIGVSFVRRLKRAAQR